MKKDIEKDLLLESYDYELPESLIAVRPLKERRKAKLLVYNQKKDEIHHSTFENLSEFLPQKAHLIFNDTKVFPCRVLGKKPSGGQVEIFFLSHTPNKLGMYPCLLKSSGKKRIGELIKLVGGEQVTIREKETDGVFFVDFSGDDLYEFLLKKGQTPIPPYIRKGESDEFDSLDYQTAYAKNVGSVAAPTAGFHFDESLLAKLENRGFDKSTITLHVGLGTFRPVQTGVITQHKMHQESFDVREQVLEKIKKSEFNVAVGTTTLRTLESLWPFEKLKGPQIGSTDLFLHPGKQVHSIQALITNFHLPKSSLLMLVASLVGREKVLKIYKEAIQREYRFFSYGDGMLILRG